MRIGVDVGGTNTDAVIMYGRNVLSTCKSPTTANVTDGIVHAINHVLEESGTEPSAVQNVMIGTTQFTNAFVERKNLLEVAAIRIALPATRGIPPLIDWPKDVVDCVGENRYLIRGGYHYDGRLNSSLDESALRAAAQDIRRKGIRTAAITGLFSPVLADMEVRAAEILESEIPEISVTLSSKIGRIGILERENATIMNASLAELARSVVAAFRQALRDLAIDAPFFISQNDGTLMSADHVESFPVLTFASGPTNSMRGAAYLSGRKNAIVADIGGTTTDIGMLVNGFPRESSLTVDIGGVRTNFRMPDILAIGLGGGSVVETNGSVSVGPKSVGFEITEKALCFGGSVLTSSDVAVAAGYANMGDRKKLDSLDSDLIDATVNEIHRMLSDSVDRIKTSADPVPLILVGGGSVLINRHIDGTSETVSLEHASVANAIGACIAQIGGEIDSVYSYEELGRDAALDSAKADAIAKAVESGADPSTVEITEVEEMPLQYVPGGTVRVRVKAVGELVRSNAGS